MPIPQSRPRFTRNGHVYDDRVQYKKKFREELEPQIPMELFNELKEAEFLEFHVNYFFRMGARVSKKMKKKLEGTPHTKRPDIDNLLKFTLDCFLPYIKDDGCVYRCTANKIFAYEHSTEITLHAMSCVPEDYANIRRESMHVLPVETGSDGKATLVRIL